MPPAGLTVIRICALVSALFSATQFGPRFPTVQPGAGVTEMPCAMAIASSEVSVTAAVGSARMVVEARTASAVTAAAPIAPARHPARRNSA